MKGLIAVLAVLSAAMLLAAPQAFAARVSEEGGDKGDEIVLYLEEQ